MIKTRTFLHLLISLFALFSQAASDYYDEVFDDHGKVRPQYQMVHANWIQQSPLDKQQFLESSRRIFRGDNALDPMARVFTHEEMVRVRAGVEERGKAVLEFLKDIQSSKPKILEKFPELKSFVDRIVLRNGERLFQRRLDPKNISFLFGPDLVRDKQGNWLVIEDNIGFVGGIGDLKLAQKHYFNQFPDLRSKLQIESTEPFFDELFRAFNSEARKRNGKLIYYSYSVSGRADNEDKRLLALLEEYGVEAVSSTTPRKIKVRKEGVFVGTEKQFSEGKEEKVGFVFMMAEPMDLDTSDAAVKMNLTMKNLRYLLKDKKVSDIRKKKVKDLLDALSRRFTWEKFRQLERISKRYDSTFYQSVDPSTQGLIEAILQNKVGSSYSPGIDFVTDKEFYLQIENLVRFYLHKEPILKNIPTESFLNPKTKSLDQKLMERVFSKLDQFVIKRVDGRGGDAVWVGNKTPPSDWPALQQKIQIEPESFIVQEYVPMPRLNDLIVDSRFFAQVFEDKIVSSTVPFGRGLPIEGNGKVNLSDTGREITVLVMKPSSLAPLVGSCSAIFEK